MLNSIHTYLEPVLNAVEPSLIQGSSRKQILSVGKHIPTCLTKFLVLECRLGEQDGPVDLSICVRAEERRRLAQYVEDPGLRQLWEAQALEPVQKFVRYWKEPGEAWEKHVHVIWLEFDMDHQPKPSPGFFFGLRPLPWSSETSEDYAGLIHSMLAALRHDSFDIQAGALDRVLKCLPAGAQIFQVGLFLSRPNHPVRICVNQIAPEMITGFLQAIGYPYDLSGIDQAAAELAPLCKIDLAIDIDQGFGPKVGLECHQTKGPPFDLLDKDSRFLDYLVAKGWCTKQKQLALMRYFGFGRLNDLENDPPDGNAVIRDIMHCKLVFQPGAPVEAKAYLLADIRMLAQLEMVKQELLFEALNKKVNQLIAERENLVRELNA